MADIVELVERSTGVHVSNTLACGEDHIVILDSYQATQLKLWDNLRRVNSQGDLVWAASAPGSGDTFIKTEWQEGLLVAWTWQCYLVTLDHHTGKVINVKFTK